MTQREPPQAAGAALACLSSFVQSSPQAVGEVDATGLVMLRRIFQHALREDQMHRQLLGQIALPLPQSSDGCAAAFPAQSNTRSTSRSRL